MKRLPKTADEFLDLVDEAIYEIDEIMMCAADEGDPEDSQYSELLPLFEQIHRELKALHAAVIEGRHVFADGADLRFMPLMQPWRERIPFRDVLETLNQVHKTGVPS